MKQLVSNQSFKSGTYLLPSFSKVGKTFIVLLGFGFSLLLSDHSVLTSSLARVYVGDVDVVTGSRPYWPPYDRDASNASENRNVKERISSFEDKGNFTSAQRSRIWYQLVDDEMLMQELINHAYYSEKNYKGQHFPNILDPPNIS